MQTTSGRMATSRPVMSAYTMASGRPPAAMTSRWPVATTVSIRLVATKLAALQHMYMRE